MATSDCPRCSALLVDDATCECGYNVRKVAFLQSHLRASLRDRRMGLVMMALELVLVLTTLGSSLSPILIVLAGAIVPTITVLAHMNVRRTRRALRELLAPRALPEARLL